MTETVLIRTMTVTKKAMMMNGNDKLAHVRLMMMMMMMKFSVREPLFSNFWKEPSVLAVCICIGVKM